MSEAEIVAWNNLITILLAINLICILMVWAIPAGHCQVDCSCKKTNRSHK